MSNRSSVNDGCFVLMAHGSKNSSWLRPFQQLALNLKKDPGDDRVHLCFMELASPTLEEIVEKLVHQGTRHVRLLPLFFARGSHLRQDVPEQLTQLKRQFPELVIDLLPPIGETAQFAGLLHALLKQQILALSN